MAARLRQARASRLTAVNDAPALTGAQATLAAGTEDTSYTISKADLLAGYTDVENDTLSVSGPSSNDGTWAKNADDSWTFTPAANFNGQVNLSYTVSDGNGGCAPATQSFCLTAVNDAPALTGAQATLAAGTEDTSYTISKADLLAGYTDVETTRSRSRGCPRMTAPGPKTPTTAGPSRRPPTTTVRSTSATPCRRQWRLAPASQSFSLAAVNDAPALTGAQATLAAGTEDTSYTISKADLLAGYTDVETTRSRSRGCPRMTAPGPKTPTTAGPSRRPPTTTVRSTSATPCRRQWRLGSGEPELLAYGGQRRAGSDRGAGHAGGRHRGHELHDQQGRSSGRLHRCGKRRALGLGAVLE